MRSYSYMDARAFYEHSVGGLEGLAQRRRYNAILATSLAACTLGTSVYLCYRVGVFDGLVSWRQRSSWCREGGDAEHGREPAVEPGRHGHQLNATEDGPGAQGQGRGLQAQPGGVEALHAAADEAEGAGVSWRQMLEDAGDDDDDTPVPVRGALLLPAWGAKASVRAGRARVACTARGMHLRGMVLRVCTGCHALRCMRCMQDEFKDPISLEVREGGSEAQP